MSEDKEAPILCDRCGKEPAVFRCAGDSKEMPAHLKHLPHYSCYECDYGCGCLMVAGKFLVAPKNEEWTPESRAAHAVRCEFAALMGLGQSSIRDPKWLVDKFRRQFDGYKEALEQIANPAGGQSGHWSEQVAASVLGIRIKKEQG